MQLGQLLPFLLIAVLIVPMVLMSRKQKKVMQQQQELQNSIGVGDRVMTTSGLYGTVSDTDDPATVDIEIAPGVHTTWLRAAVREKVGPDADVDEEVDDEVSAEVAAAEPGDTTVVAEADEKDSVETKTKR